MMSNVLDHGYVVLVESWGSDERIIESARMSTSGAFRGWGPKEDGSPGDERLLRYLWKNGHHSPFEMAGVTVEVQAPIFVFRQWMRHRVQSFNEHSGRYAEMPDLCFTPTPERVRKTCAKNKQGSDGEPISLAVFEEWCARLERHRAMIRETYEWALAQGISKELARIDTPLSNYTKMRASAKLRNWLDFLRQRLYSHAQEEIQEYAKAIGSIVANKFPRTWALFSEGT